MHFTAVREATVKMATDRDVCFQSSKQHHVSGWSTARQTACGRWVRKTDSYRVTQFAQKSFSLMHCITVTAGPQALHVADCSTLGVLQTRYIELWCVTNKIYRTTLFRSVTNIWQHWWQASCSTISGYSSCLLLAAQIWQETVAYRGGGVWGVQPPPPKFRRPSKIVPNSTRLRKLLKIAEFMTPTSQGVRKKRQ